MLAQTYSEIICGLMFFFSSSVSFPLLTLTDHKKTYGEEHGSCQAGIAGVFTEVSRSTSLLCVFTCVALRWLDYMYEHRHITVCDWYIHSPGFTQICLIIYSPNLWCFEHKWRCLAESPICFFHLWLSRPIKVVCTPWCASEYFQFAFAYVHMWMIVV